MTIDSRTSYVTQLGLKAPSEMTDVEMKQSPGEVHIRVTLPADTLWVCPQCSSATPIHDHQDRHWRHLDTCQFPTIVHARVPRLKCPTHGIEQLPVPWAEVGSRFTRTKRRPRAFCAGAVRLEYGRRVLRAPAANRDSAS